MKRLLASKIHKINNQHRVKYKTYNTYRNGMNGLHCREIWCCHFQNLILYTVDIIDIVLKFEVSMKYTKLESEYF